MIEVLKRKKLTIEAFKSKKFQENFLSQIREAVRDVTEGYCMAAALKFKESEHFPTGRELAACVHATKSHSGILLSKFKEWLNQHSKKDAAFRHHCSAFL